MAADKQIGEREGEGERDRRQKQNIRRNHITLAEVKCPYGQLSAH